MPLENWLAFTAASALLLAVPGPTLLTVVAHSLAHGRSAGVPLVAAVAAGDSAALAMSVLGLGALLETSVFWFTIVKAVGVGYLLLLGLHMLLRGQPDAEPSSTPQPVPRRRLFFHTALVTALNPKGIVFFVAFLPLFVDAREPAAAQLWVLAVTFVILGVMSASLYTAFAAGVHGMLRGPVAERRFRKAGGGLLLLAGIGALLWRRAPVGT